MTPEEIKNTAFYKSLSELSNSDRGSLFEKHDTEIEKALNVKLVKHSYTELGKIKTENPMISYQENWGSFTGSLIALMEFVPQS
jgi:hypothetical protein